MQTAQIVVKQGVEPVRWGLEKALIERDAARDRFEASIGTSAEMGAYVRLRAASRRVSAAERLLHRDD